LQNLELFSRVARTGSRSALAVSFWFALTTSKLKVDVEGDVGGVETHESEYEEDVRLMNGTYDSDVVGDEGPLDGSDFGLSGKM